MTNRWALRILDANVYRIARLIEYWTLKTMSQNQIIGVWRYRQVFVRISRYHVVSIVRIISLRVIINVTEHPYNIKVIIILVSAKRIFLMHSWIVILLVNGIQKIFLNTIDKKFKLVILSRVINSSVHLLIQRGNKSIKRHCHKTIGFHDTSHWCHVLIEERSHLHLIQSYAKRVYLIIALVYSNITTKE